MIGGPLASVVPVQMKFGEADNSSFRVDNGHIQKAFKDMGQKLFVHTFERVSTRRYPFAD